MAKIGLGIKQHKCIRRHKTNGRQQSTHSHTQPVQQMKIALLEKRCQIRNLQNVYNIHHEVWLEKCLHAPHTSIYNVDC